MSRYRYIRPLGQGTTGQSYLAEDNQTNTLVVIKRFFQESSQSSAREMTFLRALAHPAIPSYVDSFIAEVDMVSRFHLVTRHVEAEDLTKKTVDPWQLAAQGLHVLQYLHEQTPSVIHRDIKPSNLLWTTDNTLRLIDFGSAIHALDRSFGHTIMAGTLGYQAPEQIHGDPIPSSDLYSLGAVIVEQLSGKTAFSMLSQQVIDWEGHVDLPPITILWLRKMLHPSIEERFSSAEEALYALSPILKAMNAEPITAVHHPKKWLRLFSQPAAQETKEKWKGWVLLQERATKGVDWGVIAQCWKLLGEEESFRRAKDKERVWLRSMLSRQEGTLKGFGISVSLDELLSHTPISIAQQTLEEDIENVKVLFGVPPIYEIRLILKRLVSRYSEADLRTPCTKLEADISSDQLPALEELYTELGLVQRAQQVRFIQTKKRSEEAKEIQEELLDFEVEIEFSLPIRVAALAEGRERLLQQRELQADAQNLESLFSDRSIQWMPLLKPYSQVEIEKRTELLKTQSTLNAQWEELRERAMRIGWNPKNLMLSPIALEAFRTALAQQEEYFARICASEVRVRETMSWAPRRPKTPYNDPSQYEENVQRQLEFHATLVLAYEAYPRSVRRLVSRPTPPHSQEKLDHFFAEARVLSSNRLAERILQHRKWGVVLAPILGVLLYVGFQQWGLKQQVDSLHARFPTVGESIPHPSCVECPPLRWPSIPYQQYEIDAFHTNLLEHERRMKRFQRLVNAAEAVDINTEIFQEDPSLAKEAELKKIVDEQYVPLEELYLLRRDAERLRLSTEKWPSPMTIKDYQVKQEQVVQAKRFHKEAEDLQSTLRIPIPFEYPITQLQLALWKSRVRSLPKVQELFSKYKQIERSIPYPIQALEREVDQELFSMVMERNPSQYKSPQRSVHNVHWFDAIAFADRLNWYLQIPSCYIFSDEDVRWIEGCSSWRLPTKEEWLSLAKKEPKGKMWGSAGFRFPKKGAFYGDLWELVWERYEEPLLPARPYLLGGDWSSPRSRTLRSIPLYGKGENISFRLVRADVQGFPPQPDQQRRPFFETENQTKEELKAKKAYRVLLERGKDVLSARDYAQFLEEQELFAEAEEFYERGQVSLCLPSNTRRIIIEGCDPFLIEETHWQLKEKGNLSMLAGDFKKAKRYFSQCSAQDITCLFALVRVMQARGEQEEASDLFCVLTSSQRRDSKISIPCDTFIIPIPQNRPQTPSP